MAKVESKDLLISLNENKMDSYKISEQENLIQKYKDQNLQEVYPDVFKNLNQIKDVILKKGIELAYLGAIYSFKDRELNPLELSHFEIFQIIKTDIEDVYKQIKKNLPEEKIWLFECFDYGIKHVYYLDWTLYLSKTCY
jgi:hypothetical protein